MCDAGLPAGAGLLQRLGRPVGQTVGASAQRRKQPGNAAGCPGQGIDVIGHGTVHGVRDAGLVQLTQAQADVGEEAQVQLGHVGWLHFPVRRQLLHGARGVVAQHVQALAALPGHDQKMPGGPHGQGGRPLKGTGQPGTGLGGGEFPFGAGAQHAHRARTLPQLQHHAPFGLVAQHMGLDFAFVQVLFDAQVVGQWLGTVEGAGGVQQGAQGSDAAVVHGAGQQQSRAGQDVCREAAVEGGAFLQACGVLVPVGIGGGECPGEGMLGAPQRVDDAQAGHAAGAGLVAQVIDADARHVGSRHLAADFVEQRFFVQQQPQAGQVGVPGDQGMVGVVQGAALSGRGLVHPVSLGRNQARCAADDMVAVSGPVPRLLARVASPALALALALVSVPAPAAPPVDVPVEVPVVFAVAPSPSPTALRCSCQRAA